MTHLKKLIISFIVILIVPCIILLSACDFNDSKYITNIQKTDSVGLVDTYTITYSDNTTSSFYITNGKNGEDGTDVKIDEIYNNLVSRGYSGSFQDFLQDYLNIELSSTNKTANINKAILSAVSIYSEFKVVTIEPVLVFGGLGFQTTYEEVKNTQVGAGSGIIYKLDKENGDAYLITNYHVVYNKSGISPIGKLKAFLYGSLTKVGYKTDQNNNKILDEDGFPIVEYSNDAIECEYIGGSLNYDIAVLKITNSEILKNSDATQVSVADGFVVGETAIAIGNPEAQGISVTEGIISVESEYMTMTAADDTTIVTFRTIRIDTAINSGNSGGGLFNEKGELIGIVNAKVVSNSIENIAYAIPKTIVINVANNLIKNYEQNDTNKVYKLTIGLTLNVDSSTALYNKNTLTTSVLETVSVKIVEENSLAKSLNFIEGDIIKSIKINDDEYNISRMYEAIDLTLTINVGDSVTYTILRDNVLTEISFVANAENFSYVN